MQIDTLILGAGAAGLYCAAYAGGPTLVIDHAKRPAEKVRISGGGRCNFTNLEIAPERFLSANPHFHRSALARHDQWAFIDRVSRAGIGWHEKTLGQLFCNGKSTAVVDLLVSDAGAAGADIWLDTHTGSIEQVDGGFRVALSRAGHPITVSARRLVVATGGKSIPKMGATGLAYDIARQFGLTVTETRPALVPLTFTDGRFAPLSGTACPARAANVRMSFDEAILFTHRGLSGPAILQLSSYWREGEAISLTLDPAGGAVPALRADRARHGRVKIANALSRHVPARLAEHIASDLGLSGNLADQPDAALARLSDRLTDWRLVPQGSEGWRTAEVTLGGIDTVHLDGRTMETKAVPGLYFIGECVDVTGWLGGYNFQWAWSSAWAAGTAIAAARTRA
ncbi:MAG: aminoacetone oxidase family FAD-binding enzyme [Pseudomonadota bacterium]